MLTLQESAAFALAVYEGSDVPLPERFRFVDFDDGGGSSGFYAEFYSDRDLGLLTIRGSDAMEDFKAYPAIAVGGKSEQANQATAFLADMIEKHPEITHIHVVGHSLGDNNGQRQRCARQHTGCCLRSRSVSDRFGASN